MTRISNGWVKKLSANKFHQGGHECKGGHCQIGLGGQRAQDGEGGLNAKNSEQVTSLFWNESSREESEDLELRVSRVIRTIGIKSSNICDIWFFYTGKSLHFTCDRFFHRQISGVQIKDVKFLCKFLHTPIVAGGIPLFKLFGSGIP